MTKKDYDLVNAVLRGIRQDIEAGYISQGPDKVHTITVGRLADAFEKANPKFDRDRFTLASYPEPAQPTAPDMPALQCEGERGCTEAVAFGDRKGWVYCTKHKIPGRGHKGGRQ